MAELRTEYLGASPPPGGDPTASERLAAAYAEPRPADLGGPVQAPSIFRAARDPECDRLMAEASGGSAGRPRG